MKNFFKTHAEPIFTGVLIALFVSGIVLILVAVLAKDQKDSETRHACQESCGIVLSKIIDDNCFCATETGWQKH